MNDETATTVELKIDPDIGPATVVIDKEPSKTTTVVDDGIQSLRDQVEQAKRDSVARLAAKDVAIQEACQRAQAAETELTTVKKDQVGTIIDSLTKDKEAAKRDYKSAMEAGDFDRAGDAQDRISLANSRIVAAEQGKHALEEETKAAATNGRNLAQPAFVDNVEKLARSMDSRRSADWVRAHPEVVVGNQLSDAAMAAHYDALKRGIAADSDAYFAHIEGELGVSRRPARQEAQSSGREAGRAPISAPVGRDAPQSPGPQRAGTISLSANEVRTAIDTLSPIYPKASREEILQMYAKNKQALISENHPNYTGGR